MTKKRVISVLMVLALTLGVMLPEKLSFAAGRRNGMETEDTEEITAGISWKLTFYERKDLRNAAYRVRALCRDSELLERLDIVKENEQEASAILNTSWAEAYCAFLEKALKKDEDKIRPTGFRLVYLDDDNVPELFIMEDDSHSSGVKIFTYYHDEVAEVGEFGSMGQLSYVERQGRIGSFFMAYGEEFIDYYVLDGGKVDKIGSFHAYPDLDYEDDSVMLYEIDEEPVAEAVYYERERALKGDEEYDYINYDDAVFVDDTENLRTALAQEIEALELKDGLTLQQREAVEAYEDFLEEYAKEFLEKEDKSEEDYAEYEDDGWGAKFKLIYLDDDEIPELVISKGISIGHAPSVYTYADKKVVHIEDFGCYGEIVYVEKEGILLSEYGIHSHDHYDVFQVKGVEADKLIWLDEYWSENYEELKEEPVYTVDEKEAGKEEYMALYNRYEEYQKRAKRVTYKDGFVMLDGNIKGHLNQALEELLFEDNPFFYPREDTLLSADIQCEGIERWEKFGGELEVKWLKRYKNGDLFKLTVSALDDMETFLGQERRNIYFYVTPDEIYRLWSYYHDENEQLITFYDDDDLLMETFDTDEKMMANGELVFCMERVEDELGKEDLGENEMGTPISQIGKHFSIIPKGEQVTYSRYDVKPNGERDFYESFVWERGKGLVEYKSGFRAEAEILYMENISVKD